jgi:general secretion pathway protein G
MLSRVRDSSGVTLVELMVTLVILAVLATGIMPLSQMVYKRSKEMELKQHLRTIRRALDEYKRLSDERKILVEAGGSGYPKTLEVLVEGIDLQGAVAMKKRFLRRIPKDPMTEEGEWGLRSYFDEPDSGIWGGQDVYDVYSKSDKQALDGSYYKDW